jgi:hypothetical protein
VKNHTFLDSMEAGNFLMVVIVTVKTYPILAPFALMLVPWKVIRSIPRMINEMRVQTKQRLQMSAKKRHSDYFEVLLPDDKPADMSDKRVRHMLTVAGQLEAMTPPRSLSTWPSFFCSNTQKVLKNSKRRSGRPSRPTRTLIPRYLELYPG